ncbi:MAG: PQQ-like beta-propeller repeat protein, partial [Candidatus Sumerlaeia bacterium]|nr:PQQ-like beta-propeller repeat protein [Candidatus Sumerlaeia bacterium]
MCIRDRPYAETATDAPDETFNGKTVHVFPKRGTYTVVLTVYDQYGNKSQDTGIITVKARPSIYYMALRPSPAIAGENVSFDGRGSDSDGDAIVAYAWRSSIDGVLSGSRTFSSDLLTTGDHIIYFKVRDSDGLWSRESPWHLAVMPAKKWDMFKMNDLRHSSQSAYWGRYYGLLNYGVSWSYATAGPVTGSPVAANIDGDWTNGLEIAFTSADGKLHLVNNAGNLLWSRIIGPSSSTPAIEALTAGGMPCIVVGGGNSVFAFDNQGNQLWQFIGGGSFNSTPVIADINFNSQDGKEVIIGCNDGKVYAIKANGGLRWQFPALSPPPNNQFIGSAAVADIDSQQWGMETVIGCQDGQVYVLDTNGALIT